MEGNGVLCEAVVIVHEKVEKHPEEHRMAVALPFVVTAAEQCPQHRRDLGCYMLPLLVSPALI